MRLNANLFNVSQLKSKPCKTRAFGREMLFVDDSALVAHSADNMQAFVDCFANEASQFNLKINIKNRMLI